jgi:hypothetical protein
MTDRLAREHRLMALARLDQLGHELAQISTWLDGLGELQAAELLDYAARDVAAACWELQAPLRRRVTRSPRTSP